MCINNSLRFLTMILVILIAPAHHAYSDPIGLTDRPENLTCVAPARPIVDTSAALQPAWPNLNLVTLPSIDDFNYRNGFLSLAQLPGDNSHWYVVERAGRIHRVINDDSATSFTTPLDIANHFDGIEYFQQWGINAIAFHPDFATNGWIFVIYNNTDGPDNWVSYLSRFTSIDGGLTFNPATEEILLSYQQSSAFHHFDDLHFGPDGLLYLASGASANPIGQDNNDLGGKMLRINVDSLPYSIPADNPFVGGGGAPEIYASGLRNPWRFSFDSESGDLWLGDVGGSTWEEINIILNGGNYGWKVLEGTDCVLSGCDPSGFEMPYFQYSHSVGVGVVGGVVYRGTQIPELQGLYLFSDYAGFAPVWALNHNALGEPVMDVVANYQGPLSGFAEGNDGEVLVYAVANSFTVPQHATIMRLVPQSERAGGGGVTFPQSLLETGCFELTGGLQPAPGLIPYDINSALWSDGAEKRRWMALPENTTIDIDSDGDFIFPIGTVLVKEFSFNDIPVETRLLVRHDDGLWGGYSYEWKDDLSDALLLPGSKTKVIDQDITWTYPSRQACLQCHTSVANYSLGPEIAQLNGPLVYPTTDIEANQLRTLDHIGMFTSGLSDDPHDLPALPAKDNIAKPVVSRARAYLHANCSGCHRPGSDVPALIDLRFSTPVDAMRVCSEVPIHGDLGVAGALLLFPEQPSMSVLPLRMKALDVHRMPALGTDVVDVTATQLIDAWITAPDVCVIYADSDGDGTTDNVDNCIATANADQLDLDADGIGDRCDNCTEIVNLNQIDSDSDGIGNACDADLNNDCRINFQDLQMLSTVFQSKDPHADFNNDGVVNFLDVSIFALGFLSPPGPSGIVNICP